MTIPEMMQMLERLGSLGLLGLVVWLGFKFLDRHAATFAETLKAIQEAIVETSKEGAERHQKLVEAIGVAEKGSTDDVKRDLEKLRTELSDGLKELRQYREIVKRLSPQPMPAVRVDPRRDK